MLYVVSPKVTVESKNFQVQHGVLADQRLMLIKVEGTRSRHRFVLVLRKKSCHLQLKILYWLRTDVMLFQWNGKLKKKF